MASHSTSVAALSNTKRQNRDEHTKIVECAILDLWPLGKERIDIHAGICRSYLGGGGDFKGVNRAGRCRAKLHNNDNLL